MFKKILLSTLLLAAVSQAAVKDLIPELKSDDLKVQTQARLDLLAVCADAGAPDAPEGARKAVSLELCDLLDGRYPIEDVMLPVLRNLERIGDEEAVPVLAELLNHRNEQVRDTARRALTANPSDAALAALGTQLKNRKARPARETAGLIYAMADRSPIGASSLIAGALGSRDDVVFFAAVKTLGQLNEEAGARALLEARESAQGFRRTQINAALLTMNRPEVLSALARDDDPEIRAAVRLHALLAGDTDQAPDAMKSGDPVLQAAVIEAATQHPVDSLCRPVARHMATLGPQLQLQALTALQVSGNPEYAEAVEPLVQGGDDLVQPYAARTLGYIGTAHSVRVLADQGGADARRALARIDADGVDDVLLQLAAPGADAAPRAVAIEALGARGRADLIPLFFTYGGEDDRTVAGAALKVIGDLGDLSHIGPMADLMIAREKSPVSRSALLAVVQLIRRAPEQKDAVDILVSKLAGASPRSQANILKALAETGSAAALEPLAEACGSSDEQLQKTAVKALSGWKDENGIDAMLAVAVDESTSLSNHVTLMRGVSRIYGSMKSSQLAKSEIRKAVDACRRQEEKDAFQTALNRARR
ncbi:HEAT repeat domain-containing protein [Pontiella sp.]|uniref:HEAT repeat domain-containing protein n=1 Tax=Pontiella sp. TaxID=2837462 RepID=UPI0035666307